MTKSTPEYSHSQNSENVMLKLVVGRLKERCWKEHEASPKLRGFGKCSSPKPEYHQPHFKLPTSCETFRIFNATAKMRASNLITLFGLPLALAIHIRVSIPSSQQLPHPNSLPASTHATLTTISNTYSAPLRADNTFDFRNISSGSYLLDVHCHTHAFAPLRVDVHEAVVDEAGSDKEVNVWGTFRGNEWNNKGEVVQAQKEEDIWTFGVKVQGGKDYFIERAGCEIQISLLRSRLVVTWLTIGIVSPLGLLKNPMILIAGFSMLIVFGMPYIMDNSPLLFSVSIYTN